MNKFFTITLFLFATFLTNAQSKMAHLNSKKAMETMSSYKKAVTDLSDFQIELETELQAMITDYQTALDIYLTKRDELPPIRIQFEEEKLAKKEQDINQRQQAMQSEVEAYSRELNGPILFKLETATNTVAERNGYDYVFDVSAVMISNGPDITQEVIAELLILENAPPPQEDIRP